MPGTHPRPTPGTCTGAWAIRATRKKAGWDTIEFLVDGLVPAAEAAGVTVSPDEGNVHMHQVILAYGRGGHAGPLRPDQVPVSELDRSRERFMAFAIGHAHALLQTAGVWRTH